MVLRVEGNVEEQFREFPGNAAKARMREASESESVRYPIINHRRNRSYFRRKHSYSFDEIPMCRIFQIKFRDGVLTIAVAVAPM